MKCQTTNEDIKILRDFEHQMSQLSLSSNVNQELIDIMQFLPSQEDCWRLYQAFKYRVHPVLPIVHLPTLEAMIIEFWKDFPFSMHHDDLVLLLAITYCGTVSLADERYLELSKILHSAYEKLIRSYNFPTDFSTSTLARLQSYVLVNTCRASHTEPIASFGFLPSTVRTAQALKLHIDSKFNQAIELEMRRRLWWHLVYLDVEASLLSGLPNLIHEDDYTTKMPSKVHNDQFSELCSTGDEPIHPPMMIGMISRFHWALLMRRWRKRQPESGELEKFEQTMAKLQSKIPDIENNHGPRTYVSLQVDRAVCLRPRHFLHGEKTIRSISCGHQVLKSVS